MSYRNAIASALQQSQEILAFGTSQISLLQTKYRELVLHNPKTAAKMESIMRALSYILPGQFGASGILAELMFSASQLLTLLNDGIFRNGKRLWDDQASPEGNRIFLWLTVVEYLEVFIELGACQLWGEAGKWLIVIVLQISKAALRFMLLFKYKSGIQRVPLIPPLDRSQLAKLENPEEESDPSGQSETRAGRAETVWRCARSGRLVRSLNSTPLGASRNWKAPKEKLRTSSSFPPTRLSNQRLFAESLYISRPLLHISSMFLFGQNSWKPWLLSYGVDVTSLTLLRDRGDLNEAEKSELSRRIFLLLFYLLRSPFYDNYSKTRILGLLKFLSATVPGISLVLNPLMDYLPTWQQIYFYNWGS